MVRRTHKRSRYLIGAMQNKWPTICGVTTHKWRMITGVTDTQVGLGRTCLLDEPGCASQKRVATAHAQAVLTGSGLPYWLRRQSAGLADRMHPAALHFPKPLQNRWWWCNIDAGTRQVIHGAVLWEEEEEAALTCLLQLVLEPFHTHSLTPSYPNHKVGSSNPSRVKSMTYIIYTCR